MFSKVSKMVKTQFSSKSKIFQSNGGVKFIKSDYIENLENYGILHYLSYPRTPDQDGVVERKRLHIAETGLTLLFHA